MLKEGNRVMISGDADELWIEDYNCRVSSLATVIKTPNINDKKVLLNIDEIDGDRNVCVAIRRSRIHPYYELK